MGCITYLNKPIPRCFCKYMLSCIHRVQMPGSVALLVAACAADLDRVCSILGVDDPLTTEPLFQHAVLGAIARAAVSEPGSDVETDALKCAIVIAEAYNMSPESIIRLDPLRVSPSFKPESVLRAAFPILNSRCNSYVDKKQVFGLRFLEFKFHVALRDNPQKLSNAVYRACVNVIEEMDTWQSTYLHVELNTAFAADLFHRLMAKYPTINTTCTRAFNELTLYFEPPTLMLGVNLGLVKVDFDFFCKFFTRPWRRSMVDYNDLLMLSKKLVDIDIPQCLDFSRPGLICCMDASIDTMILKLLRMQNCRQSQEIMTNLLRCSQFLNHDPRYVAWLIVVKNGLAPTSAEVKYCTEWLRAELFKNSAIIQQNWSYVLWLFRHSTSDTAQLVWTLVLMLKEACNMDVMNLGGLRGLYNPFMTTPAFKCLLWNHPLAVTTSMIYLREKHFKLVAEHLSGRGTYSEIIQRANARIESANEILETVKLFPLLFRTPIPARAKQVCVSFML